MIEINLLPVVKREYLKAQQMKHSVIIAAGLISGVALIVVALQFAYVQVAQPQHEKNIQADIDSGMKDLKAKENAVKIVTVQGVLEQLPALQDKKMVTSRLFTYLTAFTPKGVSYSNIKLNLSDTTLILQGTATNFEQANVLANNLKSAKFTYTKEDSSQTSVPFSNVVFDGLSKSEQSQDGKSVSFQITLKIDPVIFDQAISGGTVTVNASSEDLLLQGDKPFVEGS